MKNKRNMQLEGLRGIAMLFVVLYHYVAGFPKHFYQPIQHNWLGIGLWGYFGVGIFILISGYFMVGSSKENPFTFTVKKMLRLWPAYFVAITICFLLTRLVFLPERSVSITTYLLNIPFINGFIGVDYVDGAHWYLTTLIACTFISTLISQIANKKQYVALIIWAIIILVFDNFSTKNIILDMLFDGLFKVFGGRYAPMFIVGMALRRNQENINLGSILAVIVGNTVNLLVFGWQREFAFIVAMVLFCIANAQKLPFLEAKGLTWLGLISYSVYVIHQNVGYWGMYLFSESIGRYIPIISLVCTVVMIGVGAGLYYFVERPCGRLIKKFINNLEEKNGI